MNNKEILQIGLLSTLITTASGITRYEADLVSSPSTDNLLGLNEITTSQLNYGDVAHVLGNTSVSDGGNGYYIWLGNTWQPMTEETLEATTVNLGGNFACIDPIHGNDLTARVGNYNRPFKTWKSATFAARSSNQQQTPNAQGSVNNRLLICAPGVIETTGDWNGSIWAPRTTFKPAPDSTAPSRATIALTYAAAEKPFIVAHRVEGHLPFAMGTQNSTVDVTELHLTLDQTGSIAPTVFAGVGETQGEEVSCVLNVKRFTSSVLGLASDAYLTRKISRNNQSVGGSLEGGFLQLNIGTANGLYLRNSNTQTQYGGPFEIHVNIQGSVTNDADGWTGGLVGTASNSETGNIRLLVTVGGSVRSLTGGGLATASAVNQQGVINSPRNGKVMIRAGLGIVSLDEGPAISAGHTTSRFSVQRLWVNTPLIQSNGIPVNVCRGSVVWIEKSHITSTNQAHPFAIGRGHHSTDTPGKPSLFCHRCTTDLPIPTAPLVYGYLEEPPEASSSRESHPDGTDYSPPHAFFRN